MTTVIVINGVGTSGKDSFIDAFVEVSPYPVLRYSSVDKIKEFALSIGWDGVKDDRGRSLLSDLKSALAKYNDLPFQYMKNKIEGLSNYIYSDCFIFFHVREPEEIHRMVDEFNAITVLVERPSVSSDSFSNSSDREVNDFNYHFYVRNDGTLEDLSVQAKRLLSFLRKRC